MGHKFTHEPEFYDANDMLRAIMVELLANDTALSVTLARQQAQSILTTDATLSKNWRHGGGYSAAQITTAVNNYLA